ncbi:uncharacterized protein FOMMEDRAFT_114740 [Fomitiporia mediterranea MF3/22]|uniref:uncharacterized protein n=1 Tax=Fomitiporia mediterranea (strain MF3/22) TaxID=694068 RepID=UPI000440980C|nr:uncharacterized protein FOMMEDRAFT_114740 [Fomitiporia mediterranea MF3/22]EJC97954.1 hypothetical protein FOMMEDRAFT_114740 [Fomitiporia mediterranea MF3/22]
MEQDSQDAGPASSAQENVHVQPSKRENFVLREEGRSLLPVSRVQRIIKADKELPIVAKEAVFAISIATEEFIKRIAAASQRQAERDHRTIVQRKDLAVVVERADEFFFLEDLLTWTQEEKPQATKKSSKTAKEASGPKSTSVLQDFIGNEPLVSIQPAGS